MSVTISNWKQICDAPTNRSLSKMAFSFSKANRFTAEKENKYPSLHSGLRSFMTWRSKLAAGPPVSGMETSTTSLESTPLTIQPAQKPTPQQLQYSYIFFPRHQEFQGILLWRRPR